MAKKNIAIIAGTVTEVLSQKPYIFKMKIKKNEKKDVFPIVQLSDAAAEKTNLKSVAPGTPVVVTGKVTTEKKVEEYKCTDAKCGGKVVDQYINTYILADSVYVYGKSHTNNYLNKIILLGTVCKDIEFRYIEGTTSMLGNTKYQLAVNRREPNATDYPWVCSYARQAEEDCRRIAKGSQILVDGIINTRINQKECTCEKCGKVYSINENLTEIVASSVEYLNNCKFEEKK